MAKENWFEKLWNELKEWSKPHLYFFEAFIEANDEDELREKMIEVFKTLNGTEYIEYSASIYEEGVYKVHFDMTSSPENIKKAESLCEVLEYQELEV